MPIDYPSLTIEQEDLLAAQAIARTSGGLTADIVNSQIAERQAVLQLILAGLSAPVCPELTNANPSAPHTVILEAQAWLLAQMAHRINQVPEQNLIAFANLFGIEPRAATFAETTLRFTVNAPSNVAVTIPANTQVTDADGIYVFQTVDSFTVAAGTATADVIAGRTVAGHTLLAPHVLTNLIDPIGFVESVTNLNGIDSGTETEPLDATLQRVKNYQRRGERIVSSKDLEDAILEALDGNGVVRAFPFVAAGDFSQSIKVGQTSVIVMTKSGENIDDISRLRIAALLDETVGNQFVYIVNPIFVEFDVSARVRLNSNSTQGATVAAIERNLRNFYSASREQFGRDILRSEIIALIEGTAGVDRIETVGAQILASPQFDSKLAEFQLPKLVNVIINVV